MGLPVHQITAEYDRYVDDWIFSNEGRSALVTRIRSASAARAADTATDRLLSEDECLLPWAALAPKLGIAP